MTDHKAEIALTPTERDLLSHAWLTNDVNRGIEWLTPAVEQIVAARIARLTSEDTVTHLQNWVPLGYDYPDKDPYPNVHEAARAILAEAASVLSSPPGEVT